MERITEMVEAADPRVTAALNGDWGECVLPRHFSYLLVKCNMTLLLCVLGGRMKGFNNCQSWQDAVFRHAISDLDPLILEIYKGIDLMKAKELKPEEEKLLVQSMSKINLVYGEVEFKALTMV